MRSVMVQRVRVREEQNRQRLAALALLGVAWLAGIATLLGAAAYAVELFAPASPAHA